MNREHTNDILRTLPNETGIYQFFDKNNKLIYVGKALSLKKRVSSYFKEKHESKKTEELALNIHRVEWTLCPSEHDALVLENNLIKTWQPKYNINLKDDKTYPYIVITNEPFPRVYMTRKKTNYTRVRGERYGPYTSIKSIRELLHIIREKTPLRTCTLNLSNQAIERNHYRPCLEYHIKKCKAPCAKKQTAADYEQDVAKVRMLLKGDFKTLLSSYKKLMKEKVDALLFEQAQYYKERIQAIHTLRSHSVFSFDLDQNIDICCFVHTGDNFFVHFAMFRQGVVLQSGVFCYDLPLKMDSLEEWFSTVLFELRSIHNSEVNTVISNQPIAIYEQFIEVVIPKRGKKKQLIDWSLSNLKTHINAKQKAQETQQKKYGVLEEVRQTLRLPNLPLRIESFDNSHLQGSSQVASMVCFENGVPSKKEYRTFHIREAEKRDDYGSMKEVVYRRYLRRTKEGKPLPQLVLIDGGKGQLAAAFHSIKRLDLQDKVSVVSIAKREEELFFAGDKSSIKLNMDSLTLSLLRHIRDETHRFAVSFHRKSQLKKSLQTRHKN